MAVFMLCIGTLWGKSVLGSARRPAPSAVASSSPAGLAALGGALLFPDALVRLSVLSYEGIAQLVPALVGGLLWRRMTVQGALAGLLVGEAIVVPLALSRQRPVPRHQRRPDRPGGQRDRQRDGEPGAPAAGRARAPVSALSPGSPTPSSSQV